MQRYICLLRSVNVSGVNLIKMKELKAFFEAIGFQNVTTYIQSGNIIFDAEEMPRNAVLEEQIQEQFHTKNVAVLLKTPDKLAEVIAHNPFKGEPDFNTKKLYVYYMDRIPEKEQAAALSEVAFEGESFRIFGDIIYVYYQDSRGNAKLSNAFFEKKLGVRATARNWNTTNKLLSLAQE